MACFFKKFGLSVSMTDEDFRSLWIILPVLFASLLQASTALNTSGADFSKVSTADAISAVLFSFFLPALAIAFSVCLSGKSLSQLFNARQCPAATALEKGAGYGSGMTLLLFAFSFALSSLFSRLGINAEQQNVFLWLGNKNFPFWLRVFLMADAVLLAPVLEEGMYRGILFGCLFKARKRFLAPALLSGAYFALMHLHAPSFLPLLAFSLCVSAGYAATRSLLTPIAMHILFNATSLFLWLTFGSAF